MFKTTPALTRPLTRTSTLESNRVLSSLLLLTRYTHHSSNVGAVAELFDISCVVDSALSPYLTSAVEALWSAIPSDTFNTTELISTLGFLGNPDVIGQHYFVPNPATGSGSSPKFDFTSARFNGVAEAFVVLAKTGDVVSPDDKSVDVDWLYLTALSYGGQGELAGSAFRVETAGGQPPASVSPPDKLFT